MSPIIQATIALNLSTVVGVVTGYYLRSLTHRCPKQTPLLYIPKGARASLDLEGRCELAKGALLCEGSMVVRSVTPGVGSVEIQRK